MPFSPITRPQSSPDLMDHRGKAIGGSIRQWIVSRFAEHAGALSALTLRHNIAQPAYGPTVQVDLAQGGVHQVSVTDGNAFTISQPMNPGQTAFWDLVIENNSGGALGAATFDSSIHQSSYAAPANGKRTSASFTIQNGISYQRTPWVTV